MKSDQINELATALAKAQGEMKGAVKDATNPFFKSSYADLASVWEALREPLSKHGLSVTQYTDRTDQGNVLLVTMLLHSSGQYIYGVYPIKTQKDDPQSLGSALSYARRYALAAITGVYQKDDDGEGAVVRKEETIRSAPQYNKGPLAGTKFEQRPGQ